MAGVPQADSPDLLESLKAHGILERLLLLEVDGTSSSTDSAAEQAPARSAFADVAAVLQRVLLAPPATSHWNSVTSAAAGTDKLLAPGTTRGSGADADTVATLHGSVDVRPLQALKALIELAEQSQDGPRPVQWGWCRCDAVILKMFSSVWQQAFAAKSAMRALWRICECSLSSKKHILAQRERHFWWPFWWTLQTGSVCLIVGSFKRSSLCSRLPTASWWRRHSTEMPRERLDC